MYNVSSCVVVNDQLIGFFRMPTLPFAWKEFRNNVVNLRMPGFTGETGLDVYYATMFHRIIAPPVRVFSEDQVDGLAAVSDELFGLLRKYSVPFEVEVSEALMYETDAFLPNSEHELRIVRLVDKRCEEQLRDAFVKLVDVWLGRYAQSAVWQVEHAEVLLVKSLLSQFVSVTPSDDLVRLGWDEDRLSLMRYVFEFNEVRMMFSSDKAFERERILRRNGFHYFW